jgi:hypothetical protein
MRLGSIGYSVSPTQPYFTPDPQQFVTVNPANGMAPFVTETTESYLQSNLVGQMQNSGQYVGWSQADWINALTADAVQRCASYPASCAGTSPQALGQKYGALAYQIMQQKLSQTIYAPPPPGNTLDNVAPTPVVVTPAPPTVVLSPPQSTPVITPTQIANGNPGANPPVYSYGTVPALPDMSGVTDWLTANWMILAAGAAALVILPSVMGGKR